MPSQRDSSPAPTRMVRHGRYYMRGGNITFLVEDTLFRVHRYFFERESTIFKDMLSRSASQTDDGPGSSDAEAIHLKTITCAEFELFLWVFYNPQYSLFDASLEDWLRILKLAHKWQFPEVKSLAVREIERKSELGDVQKIVLYHEYDIDRSLLVSAYTSLCTRDKPITVDEGNRLGLRTAIALITARERVRIFSSGRGPRTINSKPTAEVIRRIIVEAFTVNSPPQLL